MKGLRALGVRVPGPGRALARDGRSFLRSFVHSDERKFSPVFYRTSSPSGPLPKRKIERRKEKKKK